MKILQILSTFWLGIFCLCCSQVVAQNIGLRTIKDTILIDGHQFIKSSTPTKNVDAPMEKWTSVESGVEEKLKRKMKALQQKKPSAGQRSNQCLEWILNYYAVNSAETAELQAHLDLNIDRFTEVLNDLFGKTNTGQAVSLTINPQVINLNLTSYPGSFGQAYDQIILYMYNNSIDPDIHFGMVYSPLVNAGTSGGAAPQGGSTALGKTWRVGAWKRINEVLTAFHEIGHALAFTHTNGSGCVMEGSNINRDTCFTQSSIDIFNTTVINHWGDFSNGTCTTCPDQDSDNICDADDNCPTIANETQTDADNDGKGTACDCDDTAVTGSTCFENCTTFYEDQDGDGFGNPAVSVTTCVAPMGYVSDNTDNCPSDPNKIAAGDCGCGIPETDCDEVDCTINLQEIAAIMVDSLVQGRNIEADNSINNGAAVSFKAGESILLKEGFHAMKGSVFTAKIGICNSVDNVDLESAAIINTPKLLLGQEEATLKVYPNPLKSQATIQYYLPQSGNVKLFLTDFLGRKINTLMNNKEAPIGWHEIQLKAENLRSGTYFLVLSYKGQLATQKIVLLK